MTGEGHDFVSTANLSEHSDLDELITRDYALTHPGETLDDLKRRAAFDPYDLGLYRDWLAVAIRRRAACRNLSA